MPENNQKNKISNGIDSTSGQGQERGKDAASRLKQSSIATGIVVSDKMNKTIIVRVNSITRHAIYKKVVKRSRKVKAHDEKNVAKIGDVVKIAQVRPLSKDKRWKLMEVVGKNSV